MLKIHKPFSKHKLFLISIISICITFGLLGFYYLTYTPELSHAESVTTRKTLADIEYMQDVTADICANTPEADIAGNYQYQLKDSRDQKTYWVAKLKDGNCWMTQNLALDISLDGLKAKDTDIIEDWNESSTYPPLQTQNELNFTQQQTSTQSFNPGIIFCDNSSICSGTGDNTHYLSGNYYSYNAATAGTGYSTPASEDAKGSICPKNWKLAKAGTAAGSYNTLLAYYGLQNSPSNNTYSTYSAPLFLNAARYTASTGDKMASGNSRWLATKYTIDSFAYVFSIYTYTSTISVSHTNLFYIGRPIRCITFGEEKPFNDNIQITINSMLSLDVANEIIIEKTKTNPSTANLDVSVTSNQPYSININAKDHAELASNTAEVKIPSASGTLSGNSNEWGIKKPEETEYTAVTATPQLFYQSTAAEIKTIPFTIGISTAPDIPNGEYSTDITITATQN